MRPHISDDARALLRAVGDVLTESDGSQAELPEGPITLHMPAASERAGMPIGSVRYSDAVWELEHKGIIMQNPIARQMGRGTEYVLVRRDILGL
jgi:hypothetical protein